MADPSEMLIHSNQSFPEGYFCCNPSLFISQPAKAPINEGHDLVSESDEISDFDSSYQCTVTEKQKKTPPNRGRETYWEVEIIMSFQRRGDYETHREITTNAVEFASGSTLFQSMKVFAGCAKTLTFAPPRKEGGGYGQGPRDTGGAPTEVGGAFNPVDLIEPAKHAMNLVASKREVTMEEKKPDDNEDGMGLQKCEARQILDAQKKRRDAKEKSGATRKALSKFADKLSWAPRKKK